MKKHFILFCVLFAYSLNMIAIPALKRTFSFKQPDRTSITLTTYGDEYLHFFITTDGIPVFETEKGVCYCDIINNELKITEIIAHEPSQRTNQELSLVNKKKTLLYFLQGLHQQKKDEANSKRIKRNYTTRSIGHPQPYIGKKKGLVILVNFENLSMISPNANQEFNNLFNQEGYSKNDCIGSVHDYFFDQSYGKFNLNFDVIGPVTLSKKYGYYGGNSEIYGQDRNAREMITEACLLIKEKVNFKDYDWNGDGEVDLVFVIYAGYGEHAGAPSNTIWPHESNLGKDAITIDGVKINTYACSSELVGNVGNIITGIGTPCHEFSHCLGLPDLYDTDYSGAFGMSFWDVMNSGSHSGPKMNGEVPYGYSAYERWFAGWLEPSPINTTQSIAKLQNLEEIPEAYIIYNQGNPNEYYLIENHQPTKWFKYVAKFTNMHGMMITHVDYDPQAWETNSVNPNKMHQRMSIIPADNSYGEDELEFSGDLYPGKGNVTWLTNDSHIETNGKLFNKNTDGTFNMNHYIGNISESTDGIISFDAILKNDILIPSIKNITDLDENGFTINWEAIPNADYYIIEQSVLEIGPNHLPNRKSQVIDNIIGNSQFVKWLSTKYTTKIRIKAIVNGIAYPWSEIMNVKFETSGIKNITISNHNTTYYDELGNKRTKLQKGFNIIKQGNHLLKIIIK